LLQAGLSQKGEASGQERKRTDDNYREMMFQKFF